MLDRQGLRAFIPSIGEMYIRSHDFLYCIGKQEEERQMRWLIPVVLLMSDGPFFQGDRIYLRTHTELICIGTK